MTTTQKSAHNTNAVVAEPRVRTESKSGYARVSTDGQKLERQRDALTAVGCGCGVRGAGAGAGAGYRKICADRKSGKDTRRPELKACHEFLDASDTLVARSLDRYGHGLQSLGALNSHVRSGQ
ncbi:recombinase family protein [Streptomyces sp. WM4235]|uniref:recombinase family protein n=1 Tax=Streptomyces sp. WM4235 TaxID=1415551 RepID=UPI0006AECAF2|nr:recombinase family protein [Streptomyces sp. WM4235]